MAARPRHEGAARARRVLTARGVGFGARFATRNSVTGSVEPQTGPHLRCEYGCDATSKRARRQRPAGPRRPPAGRAHPRPDRRRPPNPPRPPPPRPPRRHGLVLGFALGTRQVSVVLAAIVVAVVSVTMSL